ncbi:MAG: hypothetical protein M3393_09060 [Actinomycetota bacterium]|nr:hypothetical protein [Actinomycetota bacterium]
MGPDTAAQAEEQARRTIASEQEVAEPFDALEPMFYEKVADPDMTFGDVDPARLRAAATEAIDHGAMVFLPLESDSWPAAWRPLVEWVLRRHPAGGVPPERGEWERGRSGRAAPRVPRVAARDRLSEDERALLEDLTWFGSGWAGGDPLRWSPVIVEIVLTDWIPRKIVAVRCRSCSFRATSRSRPPRSNS